MFRDRIHDCIFVAARISTQILLLAAYAGIRRGTVQPGSRLASCLLVEAADGYRAVIALPEIDPDFTDRQGNR